MTYEETVVFVDEHGHDPQKSHADREVGLVEGRGLPHTSLHRAPILDIW